jgi:nicotinamide mononucleotide transporter
MIDWLEALVAPLNQVLFTLGRDQVTWAELLGFLTGGACVWLTVRGSIANFGVGIANSAFFLVLFASARLWADSSLQVVYIVLGFVGWWQWLALRRIGGAAGSVSRIAMASHREIAGCLAFVLTGTALLTPVLHGVGDSAPFLDALTTCISLAAQWLLNAKRLQTWWFWIVADCIYVPLYLSRDLVLTAIVYALFLGLCVAGLRTWSASARATQPAIPVGAR